MAFQSGTQIRPELANADLSGFQRAAEINAQMLAQLGQDIGGAIKAHAVKKQEAKDVKTRENIAISKGYSPDVASMYAKDPDGFIQLMEFDTRKQQHQINQAKLDSIRQDEKDQEISMKALDQAYPAGSNSKFDQSAYVEAFEQMGGRNVKLALDVSKQFKGAGEVKVDSETGVITQGGKFMGQVSRKVTENIPSRILVQENFQKKMGQARKLYDEGKFKESQDILASLNYNDPFTGKPYTPFEFFEGDTQVSSKPNESKSENELDVAVQDIAKKYSQ
jgi:hypothetical protein